MTASGKEVIKNLLGQIPFAAELYYLVRQNGHPLQTRFTLKELQQSLPGLVAKAEVLRKESPKGKKVFIFATLHYWIEHAAVLGVALAAQGHDVIFGFLPYADWQKEINLFDLRRQNLYARRILSPAESIMKVVSLFNARAPYTPLPETLVEAVQTVTNYDVQYTLQIEEVDTASDIYKLRSNRNKDAAQTMLSLLRAHHPDVVIVPNGTIQEMGIAYRVARSLNIPTITYEFSDQRQHIWIAQNDEIMQQNTDGVWATRKDAPLKDSELERLRSLMASRQRATLWENFARRWQDTPAQGGSQARAALGLDARPIVLLATNVLGDSLTLGRQVFSKSMAEWISRTVQYFTGRPELQLVIRVHPGEVLMHGQSMVSVVRSVLPRLPEHIKLICPTDKVNTYDLIDVADLGLVYTTTVGLEMAMNGLPVIVAGQTHYRGRGFTHDPDSWVNYFKMLGAFTENPSEYHLSRSQVEKAWSYAYSFFFEYPLPFPWHLVRLPEDLQNHPIDDVLSPEGLKQYGDTFRYLVGEPITWNKFHD